MLLGLELGPNTAFVPGLEVGLGLRLRLREWLGLGWSTELRLEFGVQLGTGARPRAETTTGIRGRNWAMAGGVTVAEVGTQPSAGAAAFLSWGQAGNGVVAGALGGAGTRAVAMARAGEAVRVATGVKVSLELGVGLGISMWRSLGVNPGWRLSLGSRLWWRLRFGWDRVRNYNYCSARDGDRNGLVAELGLRH